jgi:hypothetical protein
LCLKDLKGDDLYRTADFHLRENINLSDLRHADDARHIDENVRGVLDTILESHRALKKELCIKADAALTSQMATEERLIRGSSKMVQEMRNLENNKDEEERWTRAYRVLLSTLPFTEMDDRYETISEADMNTFSWIFNDTSNTASSWSSLPDWLRESGSIYWINGKAGSGKSTLMRYIYEHPNTREYLSLWAGDSPIVLAGFFFWNSGALQQRTQTGLLRTLLHQILSQRADLLPEVMPEKWKQHYERPLWSQRQYISPWSVTQLQKSFALLVKRSIGVLKIGLFIDGLDEHDRDHKSLISFLENLALSENIKILTSSRPLVEFEEAFSNYPTLRLQDLTYQDIKIYVDTRLRKDKNFLGFYRKEPKGTLALVKEIVGSAEGVFLWVRLVVDSLLEGITYRDRLEDLKNRLRALPKDLEGMFQHMLDQVHSDYCVHSSRISQLVRAHLELNERSERQGGTQGHLYALLLSFAQEEDENIIYGPPKILSRPELSDRCDEILTWLKSRCAGLLEARNLASQPFSIGSQAHVEHVGNTGKHMDAWPDPPWVVSYIHRSARDFLEQDHIWARITNPTAHTGFHPSHAWTRAWILYLKRIKPTSKIQKLYGTSLARIAVEAAEMDATPLSTWRSSPYGEEIGSQIVAMHKLEILKAMAFWLIDSETFQSQKFEPYARFTARRYKYARAARHYKYPTPGLKEPYRSSAYPRQAIDTRERRCVNCMNPMKVSPSTVSNSLTETSRIVYRLSTSHRPLYWMEIQRGTWDYRN